MDTHTDSRTNQALQPIDGAFVTACDLAGDRTIASVHVTVNRRLTYDDLMRYRHLAAACNLSFVVTKSAGTLGFRLFHRVPRQRWL